MCIYFRRDRIQRRHHAVAPIKQRLVGELILVEREDVVAQARRQPRSVGMAAEGVERVDIDPDREEDLARAGQPPQRLPLDPPGR